MALATTRLFTRSRRLTCAAFLKAASTASVSPWCQSKAMFCGHSSCTGSELRSAAVRVSATAGSSSYPTSTSSAPSSAAARLSPTTQAT